MVTFWARECRSKRSIQPYSVILSDEPKLTEEEVKAYVDKAGVAKPGAEPAKRSGEE